MLELPQVGIRSSRSRHNCDLPVFCDWIEGCLLFKDTLQVSRTDVLDILLEEDIYNDQGFANDWLANVWTEFERRQGLLGPMAPYRVSGRVITRTRTWDETRAYSFCVLVSLLQTSKTWLSRLSHELQESHYARQGTLFERISDEALRGAGWKTHRTGWSSDRASRLPAVVKEVAEQLGEPG